MYMRLVPGLVWLYGEGDTGKDEMEGMRWLHLAADQDFTDAQLLLGNCYFEGVFPSQEGLSEEEAANFAVELFERCMDKGDETGHYLLGHCYEGKVGIDVDLAKAASLYQLAANQGDARAQFKLGHCYQNGIGVSQDESKALWLFYDAAQHDPETCPYIEAIRRGRYNVAVAHWNGVSDMHFDAGEAVGWFKESAALGLPEAQLMMGYCCEHGIEMDQDAEEAERWYALAKEQGVEGTSNGKADFLKE
jgi:uncharacterized protein